VALLVGFSAFLVSQAVILLLGFAAGCAARRRLRTTAVFVVAAVVAGFATIWCGGAIVSVDLVAGRCMVVAGLILVFVGFPAWGLIGAASQLNNPIGVAGWARFLSSYLAACWMLVIFLGVPSAIFVFLVTAPPGSLR